MFEGRGSFESVQPSDKHYSSIIHELHQELKEENV